MPSEWRAGSWSDELGAAGELLELVTARPAWWADAACRTAPPGVTWFPERGDDLRPAKAICAGCPVLEACGALAAELDTDGRLQGIWAGLSARDRRRLRPADWGRRPRGGPASSAA